MGCLLCRYADVKIIVVNPGSPTLGKLYKDGVVNMLPEEGKVLALAWEQCGKSSDINHKAFKVFASNKSRFPNFNTQFSNTQLFQRFFPIRDIATYRLNKSRGQII